MKIVRQIGLLVLVLIGGCMPASTAEPALRARRPKAGDIVEFTADEVSVRTHLDDFEVKRKDIEKILRTWHQVSQEHWQHGYSHVSFRDRTGTIRLKDGTLIRWMVRPGGLAMLAFQDGTVLHFAKELTPWEKDAEPVAR